jgi:hypothetical protein
MTVTISTKDNGSYTLPGPPLNGAGGVSPQDNLVRNIFVRGGFWSADGLTFVPASEVTKIEVST